MKTAPHLVRRLSTGAAMGPGTVKVRIRFINGEPRGLAPVPTTKSWALKAALTRPAHLRVASDGKTMRRVEPLPNVQTMLGSVAEFGPALRAGTVRTPMTDRLAALLEGLHPDDLAIAELGTWNGGSAAQLAGFLGNRGELHLFDYEDIVTPVVEALRAAGIRNATAWSNSRKLLDSYCWSLRRLMIERPGLRFDYVYIDGAHTWAVDGFAFLLSDLLLKPGGFVEFDDYHWTLRNSSLDPRRVPETALLHTEEQIATPQVRDIVELLAWGRNYEEILPQRIYRKPAG